ncbi:MAG: hypothetical protein ABI837_15070 [Acidobacteriota bacterium]
MTKRELIERLTHDPIVVEPISPLTYYRVALCNDPDPNGGVWLALASIGGMLVVEDYAAVHAHLDGKTVRLTNRDTDQLIARLRRLFTPGGAPRPTARERALGGTRRQ